jgi:hypothetical protein
VIRLGTPDGKSIREAGFGLVGTSGSPKSAALNVRGGAKGNGPSVVRNVEGEDNTFRLVDLPADRYEVTVQAEGSWQDGSSYWYHEPIEVDLAPGSVEVRRIETAPGGSPAHSVRQSAREPGSGRAARSATPLARKCRCPSTRAMRRARPGWAGTT